MKKYNNFLNIKLEEEDDGDDIEIIIITYNISHGVFSYLVLNDTTIKRYTDWYIKTINDKLNNKEYLIENLTLFINYNLLYEYTPNEIFNIFKKRIIEIQLNKIDEYYNSIINIKNISKLTKSDFSKFFYENINLNTSDIKYYLFIFDTNKYSMNIQEMINFNNNDKRKKYVDKHKYTKYYNKKYKGMIFRSDINKKTLDTEINYFYNIIVINTKNIYINKIVNIYKNEMNEIRKNIYSVENKKLTDITKYNI